MRFSYVTLDGAADATGVVVAIDVLRAFTTAAYAFDGGVQRIVATATVPDAFAARDAYPGSLVMGEVEGLPVEGFDLDNSPQRITGADLDGRTLIQRTTAGTQGLVRAVNAEALFAASLVCAEVTAQAVAALEPDDVTFVITGQDVRDGDEDRVAADWITARLQGEEPNPDEAISRVINSDAGGMFTDPDNTDFDLGDLYMATKINATNVAMRAQHDEQGRPVLHPVRPGAPL